MVLHRCRQSPRKLPTEVYDTIQLNSNVNRLRQSNTEGNQYGMCFAVLKSGSPAMIQNNTQYTKHYTPDASSSIAPDKNSSIRLLICAEQKDKDCFCTSIHRQTLFPSVSTMYPFFLIPYLTIIGQQLYPQYYSPI